MTNQEAIEAIKLARSQVEWDYPMDYAAAFDKAIEALEQEPTLLSSELEKNSKELEKDFGELDCISREQALVAIRNLYPGMPRVDFNGSLKKWVDKYRPYIECDDAIKQLPSVTPQEPRCKDCKWWKDSDGVYRRGCGAESQCPINRKEVFEGNGYCYMFEHRKVRIRNDSSRVDRTIKADAAECSCICRG